MTTSADDRTRSYTWDDPQQNGEAARTLSGREFLEGIVSGALSRAPISATLGFDIVDVGEGTATFTVMPSEFHFNPVGTVHGGLAATLLDSALACAVHSMLPVGVGYSTVELKVNLVRPITATTGLLTVTASVVHFGSRIATSEGRMTDAAGKLYAHGTETCMVLRD